jgi:protein SCO1/2
MTTNSVREDAAAAPASRAALFALVAFTFLAAAGFALFLFWDYRERVVHGYGVNNERLHPRANAAEIERASGLPRYVEVPDFELVERSGKTVHRADLIGKIWVADFIFTHCTGQCPMMAARLKALNEALGAAPNVRLVSVSVDPERDTPEVLARYADALGAPEDRWLFLTGKRDEIVRLVVGGMQLPAVVSGGAGAQKVDVTHSDKFVLVDPNGLVRGYYEAGDEEAQARLIADVRRLAAMAGPAAK